MYIGTGYSLEGSVFENCTSLKNITLSDSLKQINKNTFKNCWSLETIILPDSLVTL